VALLPALLAMAAVSYQRPDLPPGPPAYNPVPLSKSPLLTALQARELQRSRRVSAQIPAAPTLVPPIFPEPLPTIVLAPREAPYRLGELRALLPAAFGEVGSALLVRASIEVPTGSTLMIDVTDTPDVRLASSATGFAAIIARGGTVDVVGSPAQPVRITSWDQGQQSYDTDAADGRSFLLTFGGRMDIAHADIGHLGFGTGTSSGVSWRGGPQSETVAEGPPAVGNVTSSVLHDNWFGAYTFEALDMQWLNNTFANNEAYGFDPHDLSNNFLVEGNVAYGNGRHGFIFSRGCDGNIMRNNEAYDNRGHGFMIDDGRSEDADYAEASRLPSNDNQIVNNRAYDNDGSGVEIEGGTGNIVQGNVLERNHVGVRLKNGASASVADNAVTDSRLFGINVMADAGEVSVSGNRVTGGWASIALGEAGGAQLTGNVLADASTPLVVAGQAVRDDTVTMTIAKFFKWNPLLILWTAILGVPAVFGATRLVAYVVRRRRGPHRVHPSVS
jgi:parallel beta-helix repeat protein